MNEFEQALLIDLKKEISKLNENLENLNKDSIKLEKVKGGVLLKYLNRSGIEVKCEEIPNLIKDYISDDHKAYRRYSSGDYFVICRRHFGPDPFDYMYFYNVLYHVGSSEHAPTWMREFPYSDFKLDCPVEVICVKDLHEFMNDIIKKEVK